MWTLPKTAYGYMFQDENELHVEFENKFSLSQRGIFLYLLLIARSDLKNSFISSIQLADSSMSPVNPLPLSHSQDNQPHFIFVSFSLLFEIIASYFFPFFSISQVALIFLS